MNRFEGRVALVSGAARGMGRNHALRLAEEGADIIAFDICENMSSLLYPLSTESDLAETVRLVEETGRRIVSGKADVRDLSAVQAVVERGVAEFGRLDVVSANAGIVSLGLAHELSEDQWDQMIAVNLTGVWKTIRSAVPHMIDAGNGGSIVITSSTAGLVGLSANMAHYASAKHGVVGLMRVLAKELAQYMIRVNCLHPTTVPTPMVNNAAVIGLFRPDLDAPELDDAIDALRELNVLPVPWVEMDDITSALLWLASDEARYVTSVSLPVDAGATQN